MDETSEGGLWTSIRNFFSGKSESPIENVITEARLDNELSADTAGMLLNILRLGNYQVREIMVPRTDIDCVEEKVTLAEVAEVIISSGHSRIPVYRGNKDHIVGIIHAKDLLPSLLHPEAAERSLAELMRPPFFIPETKNAKNMLLEFQNKKVHLAIAIDEYGGTSGLITLEDVLEEIVGEIEDEYDSPKPEDIQILEDESCLVSGRTSLDDLNSELGISLESDYVETVSGYLTERIGRVPQTGEHFSFGQYSFQIKEADSKQVQWVLIHPGPQSAEHE
ncbi:MAG: hemolysin family protein [Desulfovermiculus sp.]